ncbi:hypothetical protein B23_1171 [Geobacillus thermoleovorans B23]|nr:hypothetical protein B23_1171 [Geobacillus thermoleovorans B23]
MTIVMAKEAARHPRKPSSFAISDIHNGRGKGR